MLHLLSAMAYGDCLVTLSQLERLPPGARPYSLLGTAITGRISGLLRTPLPVVELLPDKAAFYTIKERGPIAAVQDFLKLRWELGARARPGDVFAYERPILRNRALHPRGCVAVYAPFASSAYDDRQALVRKLFGAAAPWQACAAPQRAVRKVLINPCARYRNRWLSPSIIENLLAIAAQRGWSLTLLDPCARYGAFRERVAHYETQLPLGEAASLLRGADLYVGPDSFFVHLAYYYAVPCFGFFHPDWLYFLLPGARERGNWCSFDQAEDRGVLSRALGDFAGPS